MGQVRTTAIGLIAGRHVLLRRSVLKEYWDRQSRSGEVDTAASSVCLFGLLLQFVLSGPLLVANGYAYTNVGGPPWQKIHPGTYFILIALAMTVLAHRQPIDRLIRLVAREPAFYLVLLINLLLSVWVVVRGGVDGLGTMIDSYWAPTATAVVLSNAPRWLCRRAVQGFLFLCTLNAVIGIGEGILHKRLFTFAPDWGVLHEPHFRASALVGHPLDNAQMMSIGIFILLGTNIRPRLKIPMIAVLFASLVAFGGRAALAYSILGFFAWGAVTAWQQTRSGKLSVLQILLFATGALTVPILLLGFLDLSIHTDIGQRLRDTPLDDASARARLFAWDVLGRLTPKDLWLGISLHQQAALKDTMSPGHLGVDIENPWILMLIYLGIVGFVIWLAALAAFAWRLMRRTSFALQLAVLSFFIVGSTSNSFGRRSLIFAPMVGAVLCAAMAAARPALRVRPRLRHHPAPGSAYAASQHGYAD